MSGVGERGLSRSPTSGDVPRNVGPLFITLLIISPAASPAAAIWAGNVAQVPKAYRLVLVAGAFVLVGAVVFLILRRVFSDSRVAAFITFFVVLALSSGGRFMIDRPWSWRWLAALVVVFLLGAIVFRLRRWWLLDALLAACSAALLLPGLISGTWTSIARAEPMPVATPSDRVPEMSRHPDIVLVILDGYTSLPVVRELFGYEDPNLQSDLAAHGFELIAPVFSAYPMTHLSVSSLLDLEYTSNDARSMVTEDGRSLSQVIGGANRLVEILSGNDYRTTMVEPGWHMSTCGDRIDVCVSDPFIDEGVGAVLSQGLAWSLMESSTGSAFTHGARHAMDRTLANAVEAGHNQVPDFLFAHVLVPHPPLYLDAACTVVPDRRLDGINMGVAGASPETARIRLEGYANQVRCVDSFVRALAQELAGTDSLVVVVGDHGSDVMGQLSTVPDDWSEPQILERMSVFLAVKAPPRCDGVSSLVTVPLFRSLVACAGGLDLGPIEERAYLVSQAEIDGQRASMSALNAVELGGLASCLPVVDENLECR